MVTLRDHVLDLARKWQTRMDLDWWIVENIFNEEEQDDYANTRALWQYRHAHITWNLANLAKLSDELLEDTVVHELTHLLLDPITSDVIEKDAFPNKAMEFATECVARALISTRRSKRG